MKLSIDATERLPNTSMGLSMGVSTVTTLALMVRSALLPWPRRSFRLLIALALSLASQAAWPGAAQIQIASGAGSFVFVDGKADLSRPMTVYTYLPKRLKPDAARIVFVMHGVSRDARGYRDTWIEHAEKHAWMIVAPQFNVEQWGTGGYSYASVIGKDGAPRDPSTWSFTVVEHLFDAIREATGNRSSDYLLYGHSEGAQFVHRLVLLLPHARYAMAVAANPGWYTMPRFDTRFPYGLAGTPVTTTSLKESFNRQFVLLLGDKDIDPDHRYLRKTPGAMAQGGNRFERGNTFMMEASNRASELDCALHWELRVVPGSAHQNSLMSQAAATILGRR